MRSMVNIHYLVVSSYLNFSLAITAIIMIGLLGESYTEFLPGITLLSWILLIIISASVMIAQTSKFLAL